MTLNKLKNEAQQIRLSEQEKAVMRAHIFGVSTPVTSVQPIARKSPYMHALHYSWFSARLTSAMAALLIVVLSGGTVYASQAALPGDTLYAVKVGVAEPMRTALAFSDEAKLYIHTDIAAERLEEAQALAAEGRLSVRAVAQIETSLDSRVSEIETLTRKIEEVKPDVAAEVSITLEEALAVHSAILASLGDGSDDDDTKKNSRSLASKTQSRIAVAYARDAEMGGGTADAIALMAPGTEAEEPTALMAISITDDTTTAAKMAPALPPQVPATATEAHIRAAGYMEIRAGRAVSDIKQVFVKAETLFGTTTAARIKSEIDRLDIQLGIGGDYEAKGNYLAAKDVYLQVYKDALAISTFLRAEQKFNKNILNILLDDRFGVRPLEIKVEASGGVEWESEVRDNPTLKGEVRGAATSSASTDDTDDSRATVEIENGKSSSTPIHIHLGL